MIDRRRHAIVITCAVMAGLGNCASGAEKDIFSTKALTELLERVNRYTFTHPYKHKKTGYNDRTWIRATYYTGVMACYEAVKDPKYMQQALDWSNKHEWKEGTDWSLANKLTCGQTYLHLYFLNKDPSMIAPLEKWVNSGEPGTPTSPNIWYLEAGRMWADSLYTVPPTLAMLAKATENKQYLEYMHEMYWTVTALLYDESYGLFYRDKRFLDAKSRNGKKVFWSRGNGWVIAGLTRLLRYLPKDDPHYGRYLRLYKQMAQSIAKAQGPDGLWRTNLTDYDEYPNPESSGSSFFCYALAWGVRHGHLERSKYWPVIAKAWKGLAGCVHDSGKLGWVQRVGAQPEETTFASTHEYGVGAFLLAGSELIKMNKEK